MRFFVVRHYNEDEKELFDTHKSKYPALKMKWWEGRILYDATYYGDDYEEASGLAEAAFEDRKLARQLAEDVGGRVYREKYYTPLLVDR